MAICSPARRERLLKAPFTYGPTPKPTIFRLPINGIASIRYHIVRHLRQAGLLIGANDLWIAAVALEHSLPLVTDNISHFGRIPDLQVLGY